MKKLFFASLIFLTAMLFAISAYAVNEGDYVTIGNYDGQPVLWRCVSVGDEGTYLISDRVITKRAFDAEASGIWAESDIRTYLNSEFLACFTEGELSVIADTEINSISYPTDASKEHIYIDDYDSAVQNADTAYSQITTDKIFLPSVSEIQPLYHNIAVFGADYYMGLDSSGAYIGYFLRDALSYASDKKQVRYVVPRMDIRYGSSVYTDKLIRYTDASNSEGIRPALCLVTNADFAIGDGTAQNPYVVADGMYCSVDYRCEAVIAGKEIVPTVRYGGNDDGIAIKYYCNSIEHNIGDACTIALGENIIYAVIYDADGNALCTSDAITINGISYDTKKFYLNEDFESENPFDKNFSGYGVSTGDSIQKELLTDDHGNVLSISAHASSTFINSKFIDNAKGNLVIETDFMLDDLNFSTRQLFYICAYVDGVKDWITPIMLYSDGRIGFNGTNKNCIAKTDMEVGKWYKITLIFDMENRKLTFALDGDILVRDADVALQYDYFSYINIAYATAGTSSKMYYDNMKIFTSDMSEVCVSYANGGKVIDSKSDISDLSSLDISVDMLEYNEDISVIAASWDTSGRLCSVSVQKPEESGTYTKRARLTLYKLPNDISSGEVSLMFWDMSSLKPCYPKIEFK